MEPKDCFQDKSTQETHIFEGVFQYDFWSIVLIDGAADAEAYARASDSRRETQIAVGLASRVASVAAPQQWNWKAPVSVFIQGGFTSDESAWDHVVEFDFDCETGTLGFHELTNPNTVSFIVPIGIYRARWSGRGYDGTLKDERDDEETSPDSYRLELVKRTKSMPIIEVRRWTTFEQQGYIKRS